MTMEELGLQRYELEGMYEALGLLDYMDYIYRDYKEYGYTKIMDFAIDEISQNNVIDILCHAIECIQDLNNIVERLNKENNKKG